MFTVEWLKDGIPVHRVPMIGANVQDTLKVARTLLDTARKASGSSPDMLRVTDHMTNQVTTEKIQHA